MKLLKEIEGFFQPKFSIIIPSFNRAGTICRSIESILNQSVSNWEIIVVDDGSTDNTQLVVEPYLSDSRIHYYFKQNEGVSLARNYGSNLSNGEFLLFLDSDDLLENMALENFSQLIRDNSDCTVFQAGYLLLDIKQNKISNVFLKTNDYFPLLSGNFIIKRDLFFKIGGYDSLLKFGENSELQHRLNLMNTKVILGDFISLRYVEQPFGGSKNLRNNSESIYYVLEKHKESLPKQTKITFRQILAVNHLRYGEFDKAKSIILESLKLKIFQPKAFIRLLLAYFPALSKIVYKRPSN